MSTPTPPTGPPARRALESIEVPLRPGVVRRLLPAVAAALDGGPALLTLPSHPAAVRESVLAEFRPTEPLEEGVAFVVPTSGSTGRPKGALLSAAAVQASATATHARLGGPGRWLLAVPATHIAGLMVLARSVLAGTDPIAVDLTDGFDPELFAAASMRLFAAGAAGGDRRYTSLVPRQLAALVDDGGAGLHALIGYDAVLVGGSEAATTLLDRTRSAGVAVVTTYGMTETCGGCVYDGRPLEDVGVRIVDGRVYLSGPVLAGGYRLRPELAGAFEGGWFTTSDAGYLDSDGRLVVTRRLDDVAVSGGVNVPLAAVDNAVASHPDVLAALSIAAPDEQWGQRIVTAVIPRDSANPPTLASVRAHVSGRAPVAYAPKELVVTDVLPTLPGGKADRRGLARRLGFDAPSPPSSPAPAGCWQTD